MEQILIIYKYITRHRDDYEHLIVSSFLLSIQFNRLLIDFRLLPNGRNAPGILIIFSIFFLNIEHIDTLNVFRFGFLFCVW